MTGTVKRSLDLEERLTFQITAEEAAQIKTYADQTSTSISRACRMLVKDGLALNAARGARAA
jgi:hypothetical protein